MSFDRHHQIWFKREKIYNYSRFQRIIHRRNLQNIFCVITISRILAELTDLFVAVNLLTTNDMSRFSKETILDNIHNYMYIGEINNIA